MAHTLLMREGPAELGAKIMETTLTAAEAEAARSDWLKRWPGDRLGADLAAAGTPLKMVFGGREVHSAAELAGDK